MSAEAGSAPGNPLLSTQSSELQAVLHPLVLLSISDYITRHTLREQTGPIVGGLMGQHNGREVTIEHAFDMHTQEAPDSPYRYRLHMAATLERIEQMRAVHKDRNLDFVGWYTLLPRSGPSAELVSLQTEILTHINESAVLLAFHPTEILDHSVGGKLPLTVYESNYEVDDAAARPDTEGDKKMHEDGEPPVALRLRFRELGCTVETDEAEMISMDFVARGSGAATAVEPPKEQSQKPQGKGKDKDTSATAAPDADTIVLSPEEEEMMSALTAKANAAKMLHSRISLVSAYLDRLPPGYVNGTDPAAAPTSPNQAKPSHTILRQIQALVGRLDLIEPSNTAAFRQELQCEKNDVDLVSLLTDTMQSLQKIREVGRKFDTVDAVKTRENRLRNPGWGMDTHHGSARPEGGNFFNSLGN